MKVRALLLLTVFIASAHQILLGATSGDWTYSVLDSQATITGYSGDGGAVDIPAVVDGFSVVKVGDGSPPIFGSGNTTVTSVTIPDSVTSIGIDTFYNCINLTSVTIGNSVTSIGEYAFYECTSLASLTIGNSVTSIGDRTFDSCTSLTSVTIPDSVTSIGNSAFDFCNSLTSITVDTGNLNYSSVDGVLFNKLQTLLIQYSIGKSDDSYTIPDSVTSIGNYAFRSCSSLTSVTIPDSVTSIGDYAFYYCTSLTSITIGNSVTSIGDYAFRSCFSFTSITIPDSVTSIGNYAFYECTSLASLTLPILFKDSYSSFSLSSDQVLLYGSPAARDVPLSNNLAAGRTLGRADVTDSPASYDLYTAGNVSTAEAASRTLGRSDVTNAPANYDLYTAGDVSTAEVAARILGQQDVTASPSVYDLHTSTELAEATAAARTIVNVSARVNLGAEETVIPGFVVLGKSKQLLIRAVGPKLADLGVPSPLPDPTMTIYRTRYDGQPNDVVAVIDDWKADGADVAAINAAMATAGAFPLEPTETFQGRPFMTDDTSSAAALVTLDVGVYTVQVSSADDGVGEVLVEVYEVTD